MPAHLIYLGLGSNLGDRAANLAAAIDALPPAVTVTARSAIYETEPWGFTDQPSFLNQVVAGLTDLDPRALLAHVKSIETLVGRTFTFRNGPREIDVDILFFDDLCVDESGLTIPHPRLHQRAFILAPLSEIASGLRHPVTGKLIAEHLAEVDAASIVRLHTEKPLSLP